MLIIYEEDFIIKQIHMKLEAHTIEIKNNKMFIYAIDILFKFYWIFNLEYPAQATNVLFRKYLYDLNVSD